MNMKHSKVNSSNHLTLFECEETLYHVFNFVFILSNENTININDFTLDELFASN